MNGCSAGALRPRAAGSCEAGNPWFDAAAPRLAVAKDVCDVLGYGHTPSALRGLDDDERADVQIAHSSSNGVTQGRSVTTINESGLYSLILGSRKPQLAAQRRRRGQGVQALGHRRGPAEHPAQPLRGELARLAPM